MQSPQQQKLLTMKSLPVLNEQAAGLDVGSEKIHASIAGQAPRVFDTMTVSLYALRDWLKAAGVTTVAMEATGVYWLCVYEVLAEAGLKPIVVNGKHVQNLPGRKTDMSDCQWLATLHAHGLLRGGFVPEPQIRRLQDYMRLRQDHISMAAAHIQHMQKALDRMNIKIHEVLSSLTGVSGMAMVEAILAGERDPQKLVLLADRRVLTTKRERLLAALQGHWKEEQLFSLQQAHELWSFYQSKIRQCDERIEALLKEQTAQCPPPPDDSGAAARKAATQRGHNAPQIEGLEQMLRQLCGGQDATAIPGISAYSLLSLLSETGTDLRRWSSAKAFTAWLGLAPASHQSGKRRGRVSRQRNRAGRLFCLLARSLARAVDNALGGFYRNLRARRGGLIANQALARKLAELYWRTLTKGLVYVEKGLAAYQQHLRQQQQRTLSKLAAKLGFQLTPAVSVHG
jgi:transposase